MHPVVRSLHRLCTRKSGATRFVDLHLVVRPDMTVSESHRLADQISEDIKTRFLYDDVILHIEPCDVSCSAAAPSVCLLTDEEKKAIHSPAV